VYNQVADAVKLCASFLNNSITPENCIDILNISELYSLDTCSVLARSFVLANFECLANQHTEEFMKLTASQLTSLLLDNALCVASEYQLFEHVIGWVRHDLPAREQHIAQLMFHVRLPLCTGEELVERVSREPLVKYNDDCYRLLVEAKDYHIVVYKQPLLQTARTQVQSYFSQSIREFRQWPLKVLSTGVFCKNLKTPSKKQLLRGRYLKHCLLMFNVAVLLVRRKVVRQSCC